MYREVDGEEVVLERDPNYEITYDDLLTYAEWYECPRLCLDTCTIVRVWPASYSACMPPPPTHDANRL